MDLYNTKVKTPPVRLLRGYPERRVTYLWLVPPIQEWTARSKCVKLFVLRPSLYELFHPKLVQVFAM